MNPKKVVQSVGDSRAQVVIRAVPVDSEDALHDGLGENAKTILVFEINDCFEIEDEEMGVELGILRGESVKIKSKIIFENVLVWIILNFIHYYYETKR